MTNDKFPMLNQAQNPNDKILKGGKIFLAFLFMRGKAR